MLLGHVHRGRLGGRRRRGEGTKGRIVPLLAESVVPTDPHSKNDASPAAGEWGRAWGEKIDVATGRLRAYPVLVLWASTNLPPQVGSSEREGVGSRDPAGLSLCCLDWGEELGGEVTGGQALFRAVELEQWNWSSGFEERYGGRQPCSDDSASTFVDSPPPASHQQLCCPASLRSAPSSPTL